MPPDPATARVLMWPRSCTSVPSSPRSSASSCCGWRLLAGSVVGMVWVVSRAAGERAGELAYSPRGRRRRREASPPFSRAGPPLVGGLRGGAAGRGGGTRGLLRCSAGSFGSRQISNRRPPALDGVLRSTGPWCSSCSRSAGSAWPPTCLLVAELQGTSPVAENEFGDY